MRASDRRRHVRSIPPRRGGPGGRSRRAEARNDTKRFARRLKRRFVFNTTSSSDRRNRRPTPRVARRAAYLAGGSSVALGHDDGASAGSRRLPSSPSPRVGALAFVSFSPVASSPRSVGRRLSFFFFPPRNPSTRPTPRAGRTSRSDRSGRPSASPRSSPTRGTRARSAAPPPRGSACTPKPPRTAESRARDEAATSGFPPRRALPKVGPFPPSRPPVRRRPNAPRASRSSSHPLSSTARSRSFLFLLPRSRPTLATGSSRRSTALGPRG